MTQNQLTYWANKERERANRAQERETHRSNVAREQHNINMLKLEREQFNRSNWHNAIGHIGSAVGGIAKAVNPLRSLFMLGGE